MKREENLSRDLRECVEFHGHLCPGLIYGYRVATEAAERLGIDKATDEEVVAVCENDSCAVDGFQTILGTTAGKGNLIINNYGKNVYTIFSRTKGKALRFSRIFTYRYTGTEKEEFDQLELRMQTNTASPVDRKRQKYLKAIDLLNKPVEEIFSIREVPFEPPPYASLARSVACKKCGELTMETRMIENDNGDLLCRPCMEHQ